MSGKELIIYILENGLENKDIFEIIKRFPTIGDVAVAFKVGTATVEAWLAEGYMDGIDLEGMTYISPASLDKFAKELGDREVKNV